MSEVKLNKQQEHEAHSIINIVGEKMSSIDYGLVHNDSATSETIEKRYITAMLDKAMEDPRRLLKLMN